MQIRNPNFESGHPFRRPSQHAEAIQWAMSLGQHRRQNMTEPLKTRKCSVIKRLQSCVASSSTVRGRGYGGLGSPTRLGKIRHMSMKNPQHSLELACEEQCFWKVVLSWNPHSGGRRLPVDAWPLGRGTGCRARPFHRPTRFPSIQELGQVHG